MTEFDEQMELFPRATLADLVQAKKLLKEFRKAKQAVIAFEQEVERLPPEQKDRLQKYRANVRLIEQSISLIIDEEVRRIIEHRFVKGQTHSATVVFFSSCMSDRTVERKLNEGITSIASTLKMWTS
ncbi:hypothetical protein [Paenibacillus silvisoli]|uniref:hypothetical protein n=1 Tax=Paenibacillus silvisoli TaxID=3110539 RepID=UPI002803F34C|nr:hypothetical protein [Paenibacillus silvisoli]